MSNTTEKTFKVAVIVKQKNGVLYKAMKEKGWNQRELGEFLGITTNEIGRVLNFRGRPPEFRKNPEKRKNFLEKLMELTGMPYMDIFPEEVYSDDVMNRSSSFDFFVDRDVSILKIDGARSVIMLQDSQIDTRYSEIFSAMEKILTPKQLELVELRYDKGMTLGEIALKLGISRERVRQKESKIFRVLRYRGAKFLDLVENSDVEIGKILSKGFANRIEQLASGIDVRDFARPEFLEHVGRVRNWPQDKINKAMGKC